MTTTRARRWRGIVSTFAAAAVVVATMAAVPAAGEESATETPSRVELSGVLRVVPSESRPIHVEAGEPAPEPEVLHEGSVALLTDSGALVELTHVDPAGLASGQRYTATVDVPPAVQEAVDVKVDDIAELDVAETADAVADVAAEEQVALPVVSASATPITAAAVPPMNHTVDVIVYTRAGTSSQIPAAGTIDTAISRMSEFWASQSAGQVAAITRPSAIKFQTVSWDVCDEFLTWQNGAVAFGTTHETYWTGSTRRHLVVLVDEGWCGGGGLGTVGGAIHQGGLIHAQIPVSSPLDWDQVLFHEFGHNITLPHSNLRECTSPIVDSVRNSATRQPADARCNDWEYEDYYDVMGGGLSYGGGVVASTRNISALNASQKIKLGALSTADGLTNVTAGPGLVQTFTLQAASAASGTRALQVTDTNGEKIVVEYRSGSGRDANSLYSQWAGVTGNSQYAPGVRVLRMYADQCIGNCDYYWEGYSLALQRHASGGGYTHAMHFNAGQQITTHTNNVTVRVLATNGTTATVEIGYFRPYTTVPSAPTISVAPTGTPYVGKTLTANGVTATGWSPAATSVSFQWLRNGAAIAGATKATYQLQQADKGAQITVRATPVRTGYRNIPLVSTAVSPVPGGPTTIERTAGASRFDTSALVSSKAFPAGADVIYVATGMNYPDALGAAPAATKQDGPLILVPSKGIVPASVLTEIARLAPDKVIVVGGEGVVPTSVVDQIIAAATPAPIPPEEVGTPPVLERIAGTGRYDTARLLVEDAFEDETVAQVYIATGRDFPDALSASAVAGGKGVPVVLVDGLKPTLDAATVGLLAQLKGAGPLKAWVVGGTGVVSAGIQSQLTSLGYTPERLAGANRYETSAKINAQVSGSIPEVFLATGTGFADALAGAVWAGVKGAPLHVTSPKCLSAGAGAQIGANATDTVQLIGGEGALSATVLGLGGC